MKTNKITLALLLAISIVTFSCKKEGSKIKKETPLKTTVETGSIVDTFEVINDTPFEIGNKFYASRNGKITKLGCKMPNTGNFKVSLWNYSTQELIATTTVNVTDITQFKYNDISPIEITANARYVISIFLTSGYAYSKKPGIPIYPFTTGSITFEDFRTKESPTSVFPENDKYITLGGVPDFQFEY